MAGIKTVGIKELKNNLSAYLREVRRGTRVLVSDRTEVVAELHEPGAAYVPGAEADAVLEAWSRAGIVTLPSRKREPLQPSPIRLQRGSAARLLDEDRDERSP